MAEMGNILVKVQVDLWSELLKQLSDRGLDELDMAIIREQELRRED